MEITLVCRDAAALHCFPVLAQLRPELAPMEFLERVRRLTVAGYRLVSLEDEGQVRAVAGFRVGENLAWGRYLYVEDLVVDEASRGRGYGKALFDWLLNEARARECTQLHLDSGVQRFDAHRFYHGRAMEIRAHHFAISLP